MSARSASQFDWLIATPIAHRGLHDRAAGPMENSLSAALAACDAGLAFECDIQRSRDGEAVVFHDCTLDRMTGQSGSVADWTADTLSALRLGSTTDGIATLPALLGTVAGRVPIICEIKSAFDGDMRLADRAATLAAAYEGPLALKSFDPAVVAHLRARFVRDRTAVPLGIVAEALYGDREWDILAPDRKQRLAALTHIGDTRPDFLSFHIGDLPHAAATLFRGACNGPVMTWTVRRPEQRAIAALWADQIIFEDLNPADL